MLRIICWANSFLNQSIEKTLKTPARTRWLWHPDHASSFSDEQKYSLDIIFQQSRAARISTPSLNWLRINNSKTFLRPLANIRIQSRFCCNITTQYFASSLKEIIFRFFRVFIQSSILNENRICYSNRKLCSMLDKICKRGF